jgi:ankyrin repeat protein
MPNLVRELIRLGEDPNKTWGGSTVFFPAARSNNPELIQLFVDLKCDLSGRNAQGWTPLMTAVRWGAPESVKKLLELGLKDPEAAAVAVSMVSDVEPPNRPEVRELRNLRYRPDYRRCLEIFEEFDQIASSRPAMDAFFWRSPHTVAEVESHLDGGGNVNFRGACTPLGQAAGAGNLPVVKILLAKGADPNLRSIDQAQIPLIEAILHPRIVELLLQSGANPNAMTDKGETILTRALSVEAPEETLRLLVRYGADPKIDAWQWLDTFPKTRRASLLRVILEGD